MRYIDKFFDIAKNLEKYVDDAKRQNGFYVFLEEGIFSADDPLSDARYPYVCDGMTFWAHQNGKNHWNDSSFFLLPETTEGEATNLSFFVGIKNEKGMYDPFSLFSYDRNLYEGNVIRGTLFALNEVVYFAKKEEIVFVMSFSLDSKKRLVMRGSVFNMGKEEKEIYSSLYLNPMLLHSSFTTVETKWFKKVSYSENTFFFETRENISREEHLIHNYILKRKTIGETHIDNTTSRQVYSESKTIGKNSSAALLKGKFAKEKDVTCFSDLGIAGDFVHSSLKCGESLELLYVFSSENDVISMENMDKYLLSLPTKDKRYECLSFGKDDRFSSFSKMLLKQVDYCASTKNSTLLMLGFRDIFQALEAAVIFDQPLARKRIIACLNYVSITGRCPRQFAWSNTEDVLIDSREFIDQGLWVIDAVYQYLTYTGDFSLLDEECGYIEIFENGTAKKSKESDTLYCHLKRLIGYLLANIDQDTGCLKTLYGDWNDAIDGLGKSKKGFPFGNGVSIMATFQLHSALSKMVELSSFLNYDEDATIYAEAKDKLDEAIEKYAFANKNEENKIVHGWGEDCSFYVGSFNDIDGKERDTLTSNAFYVLSNYYLKHPNYISNVKKAYQRLEGKYGFLTFSPCFEEEARDVGRIVDLPKGTAENAATYIHGSVFAIDSLFMLNEPKWAWDEIMKIVPINHEFISTTPFVMPNSYVYNPEIGCDGESMNDWFTGSSSTLLKSIVRNALGLFPKLNKLTLFPASYFPFEECSLKTRIRDKGITIIYKNKNNGKRKILLDGKELNLFSDPCARSGVEVEYDKLKDGSIILICD